MRAILLISLCIGVLFGPHVHTATALRRDNYILEESEPPLRFFCDYSELSLGTYIPWIWPFPVPYAVSCRMLDIQELPCSGIHADDFYFADLDSFMNWFEQERRRPFFIKQSAAYEKSVLPSHLVDYPEKLETRLRDNKFQRHGGSAATFKQDADADMEKLAAELTGTLTSAPTLQATVIRALIQIGRSLVRSVNLQQSVSTLHQEYYNVDKIDGVKYHTILRVLGQVEMHQMSIVGTVSGAEQTYTMTQHWHIRVYQEASNSSSSSSTSSEEFKKSSQGFAEEARKAWEDMWEQAKKYSGFSQST